jgi:hypothetical protein
LKHQRKDERIFGELIGFLNKKKSLMTSLGQLMVEIGKFFLRKPYVVGTLETKGAERLVINLREFDCFTFVENVIALARYVESRQESLEGFRRLLRKIRYRNGQLQGYASRLHYFSDWIYDNQKKGIVRNVTAEIGSRSFKKAINFMTTHPDLYPLMKNEANLRRMKSVERTISRRLLYYIPKKFVRTLEDEIHDGDIIAITTNTEGLDVQHVGFAVRVKNRIHLLHASSAERKVVFSQQTLYQYLMQGGTRSGIMVARVCSGG